MELKKVFRALATSTVVGEFKRVINDKGRKTSERSCLRIADDVGWELKKNMFKRGAVFCGLSG